MRLHNVFHHAPDDQLTRMRPELAAFPLPVLRVALRSRSTARRPTATRTRGRSRARGMSTSASRSTAARTSARNVSGACPCNRGRRSSVPRKSRFGGRGYGDAWGSNSLTAGSAFSSPGLLPSESRSHQAPFAVTFAITPRKATASIAFTASRCGLCGLRPRAQ